jgi:excisionase family DNA binding protein
LFRRIEHQLAQGNAAYARNCGPEKLSGSCARSMRSLVTMKLRYKEAAQHIGAAVGTLYAMVSENRIPHYRIGPRHVVFDSDDLDRWLEKHRVTPAEIAATTPMASRRARPQQREKSSR